MAAECPVSVLESGTWGWFSDLDIKLSQDDPRNAALFVKLKKSGEGSIAVHQGEMVPGVGVGLSTGTDTA